MLNLNILTGVILAVAWSVIAQDIWAASGSFVAQQIRTAAVNLNGERHDTESSEPIPLASGHLFEQASFRTRVVSHHDDDEHRSAVKGDGE